jgi:hypothetical protein
MWSHTREAHQGIIREGGWGDYRFKAKGSLREPTTFVGDEAVRLKREEEGSSETGKVLVLNTKKRNFTEPRM